MFVKVPLSGPAAVSFKSVNVREHSMLGQVLPELQTFIENHCTGKIDLSNVMSNECFPNASL